MSADPIKVFSLKNGDLLFVGGKRPLHYIHSDVLARGVNGIEPEELARQLEALASLVRETGSD